MTNPRASIRMAVWFALLAFTFITAGSEGFAAKQSRTSAGYYDHAVELIAKHDYRGAIIELKNALQADPNDLSARILLGQTYLKIEDGASAAKELLRARQKGARDQFVLAPLGRAYVLQGLYGNALKILRTAGQDDSTAAEIAIVRGDAHLALRDFDAATGAYREALDRRPDEPKAFFGLARIDIGRGQLEAARRKIDKALEADPDDAEGWYVRGEVLRQQRNFTAALKDYDQAVKIEPRYFRARMARAGIHIDHGRSEEAAADIAKIQEIQPNNPEALYLNALLLAQRGDIGAAQQSLVQAENILLAYPSQYVEENPPTLLLAGVVSYFRRNFATSYRYLSLYLDKVPHHLGARKLLASMALQRGETERAIELLALIVPHVPDDVEVLTMYGDALMRAGRHAEATGIFEKASAIAKPGSSALSKLLILQLVGGQDEAAIATLKSEWKRDPTSVKTGLMLIGAQMQAGYHEDALSTAEQVVEIHSGNPVAHNLTAGVKLRLKDLDGARRSFNQALDAAPGYMPALFNLAKLETRLGNLDAARGHYTTILAKDPENGKAMFALAELDRRRGDLDGAFRWLEKARASSRNAGLAALLLTDLYLDAKRPDEAVLTATQLHKANPADLTILNALGRALIGADQIEKAGDRFRELAERAAENKSPYWLHQSAIGLRQVRDIKAARTALDQALKYNKTYIPAYLELFKMDMAAGDLESARSHADLVATFDPASPAGDTLKGDIHMRLGQFAEAEYAYRTAFEKKPDTPFALRIYGARRAAGLDAFSFAAEWASKRPRDAAAQRLLATAHTDADRDDDALAIYERLLKAVPKDTTLLNNMAVLYQKKADPRALDYAKRAYDAAPKQPAIMDTYGWILVQQGQPGKGLAILRNAALRAPGVPEINFHMAVALKALGQTKEARREIRAALQSGRPFEGIADARRLSAELSSSRR